MGKPTEHEIREKLLERPWIEKVRIKNGMIEAYGIYPGFLCKSWEYVADLREIEDAGLDVLGGI